MYRRLRYLAGLVLACPLIFTGEAGATIITTTDFNAWKASLTGAPTELNFTSSGIQTKSYSTSAGITLTPSGNPSIAFVFTGPDNGSYTLVGNANNGTLTGASDGIGSINAATPSTGETAILLGINCTTCTSHPLTLVLSDGESFPVSSGLFGFSISHPITWAELSTTSGSAAVINDFYFGTSSLPPDPPPTAEAATAVLIGGGLLVIFGSRRKWPKRSPALEYSAEPVMDS